MSELVAFIGQMTDAIVGVLDTRTGRIGFGLFTLLVPVLLATVGWRTLFTKVVAGSVATSLIIYQFNLFIAPFAFLLSDYVEALYGALGVPRLPMSVWSGIPWWVLALVALLLYDLADYWNHRIMHLKWLWPIHAIHHSDEHVNGLTTYRVHFLEKVVMLSSYTFLLTWLGLPKEAIGAGGVLLTLHNMYVHMEVDWDHGPFKYVLASPRFHRWHHADVPELYGKNLANIFPFYDVMFGTYCVPGPCTARMGTPGVPSDDPIRLLAYPFTQWWAMGREGRRSATRTPDVETAGGIYEGSASKAS